MNTRLSLPVGRALGLALLCHFPLSAHAGQCTVTRLAELPVTMEGMRPTISAQINGKDALFTLDSGAFWSSLTPAAAQQYQLRVDGGRLPFGFQVSGVGGRTDVKVTNVATFALFNVPLHKFDFLVGGSEPGAGTVGLLGQNILRIADIEYDLAQGVVRIFKTKDCSRKFGLAYWAKDSNQAFSMVDIEPATPLSPHTVATAYLNGAKVRVTFDTGAGSSIVGLRAAAKAGIKPDGPGVESAGAGSGIGKHEIQTWIATFPTLKIGDEEVHNARLRFGDLGELDMLLGADFFLSHRIFVASSQGRVYFTYNGGPVFNLNAARKMAKSQAQSIESPPVEAHTTSDQSASAGDTSPGAALQNTDPQTSVDATGVARRAAASAARHDFEQALADYNEACKLAPSEASYFLQRGMLKINSLHQGEQGASDIDRAIELKPDYVDALVARARIELRKHAIEQAVNDLDTVNRTAPKEANLRLDLAGLYYEADRYSESVAQLDVWIAHHSQDVRLPHAYNDRCWVRALQGTDLEQALRDCNAGLRLSSKSAELFDSRGLVQIRRGAYDRAIADFDAALKINPKQPWTLYCRGVAKVGAGHKQDGETDMAAAIATNPHIAEHAKRYGIGPGPSAEAPRS